MTRENLIHALVESWKFDPVINSNASRLWITFLHFLWRRCGYTRHKVLKSAHINLHSFIQKIYQAVLLLQYYKLQ